MSTPEQTPTQVAAAAGAESANRGATREEVREDIAAALAAHQPSAAALSDKDKDEIADRMISKLEARGAFPPDEPLPSIDPNTPSASQPAPVDGPTPTPDPQPRKQTWAERFHGRKPK